MEQRTRREIKRPNTSAEWQLAAWLGLAYLLELYNFLGLKVMLGPGLRDFYKDHVQKWELGGMFLSLLLLVGWVWRGHSFRPKLMYIFKWSMLAQAILGILSALVVFWLENDAPYALDSLQALRLIWGLFLGFGLGVSFTILSRSFSRRKRTAVAALVVGMGLTGPPLITGLSYLPNMANNKWIYALFPFLLLVWVLYQWGQLSRLGNGAMDTEEEAVVEMDRSIKGLLGQGKFWRSFIWLLISGLNVQFCVNFLLANPARFIGGHADTTDAFELYRVCVFGRYLFFIGGVLFFGWLSSRCRSRRIPFLTTSLIGLVSMYCYIEYFQGITNQDWDWLLVFLLSGMIGLSNSNWLITLLQGIEIYGRRLQFVVLFTLPMFYRLVAGLPLAFEEQLSADQIWMLGMGITLFGLLAGLLWEENFEGANNLKISDDNVDKNFSVAILDHGTRRTFKKEIDGAAWKNANFENLQKNIADILDKRFQTVFEEWMYSFSIASTNLQDGQLTFNHAHVNPAAYRDLGRITPQEAATYQQMAHDLILDDHPARSLTKFALDRGLNGLVLTHQDYLTTVDRAAYQENDYRFFDLSKINLPDDAAIARFWEAPPSEQKQLFREIFEQVSVNAQSQESVEKIPEILTLRALDMWRYPKKQYFVYIVTPQSAIESESQQRIALLLMTAIKIPVSKLDELAGMLNWILTQRTLALTMDAEWRKISEEQSHSIKTVLGMLINDIVAINDYRLQEGPFSILRESLEVNIRRIDRINQFTLALMRVGEVSSLDEVDDKVKKIFQPSAVNLQEILCSTLEEIEKTLKTIGFSMDGHDEKVKALIPPLIAAVRTQENLRLMVEVAPTGLQILLTDLLSNMLFYTNSRTPAAAIDLAERDDGYCLRLTNNRKIEDKYRQLIKTSKDQTGISIQRKAGIRMVKRILGSPLFNQKSNQRWQLDVEEQNDNIESTTIVLKIIKTDCL